MAPGTVQYVRYSHRTTAPGTVVPGIPVITPDRTGPCEGCEGWHGRMLHSLSGTCYPVLYVFIDREYVLGEGYSRSSHLCEGFGHVRHDQTIVCVYEPTYDRASADSRWRPQVRHRLFRKGVSVPSTVVSVPSTVISRLVLIAQAGRTVLRTWYARIFHVTGRVVKYVKYVRPPPSDFEYCI